jgi:hypothetical protein
MLAIALQLAKDNPAYEDVATKFFEHFVYIGAAVNRAGEHGTGLWSEAQGFYFDLLKIPDGRSCQIEAFTIAGLIPLFAIAVGEPESFRGFPDFAERFNWFRRHRPELLGNLADISHRGVHQRLRLALVDSHKLTRILAHVLDPAHLLSPNGVRSVSRRHVGDPFVLKLEGREFKLDYEPAEATSTLFGGNSNWRGPVWFPLNYLLIEALQKHDFFLGDAFHVRCGEHGDEATLWQVASDLSARLIKLFTRDEQGRRPAHGRYEKFQSDPHWKDLILFYEYFNGDTGAGLGASHQTGWTGLVAKLIQQHAEYTLRNRQHEVVPGHGARKPQDKAG